MDKKVLFVIHRIGLGGSMTSMLNLFELMKKKYGETYDLLIMDHNGKFLERAKKVANVLPENGKLAVSVNSFNVLLKKKNLYQILFGFCFKIVKILSNNKISVINIYEKEAKKYKGYDVVIAYQEGPAAIFASFIEAKEKITWFHQEYKYAVPDGEQKKYYEKFDKYVCVSDVSRKSVIENLSHSENNTFLIYNTFNVDYIREKSGEYLVPKKEGIINLVSCGRVAEVKKFDRIVYAAQKLKEEGYKFHWRVVGGGDLLDGLKEDVIKKGLTDCLEFVGPQINPYPYFVSADCLVLSSLYETHPMVVIEAFSLGIPVVSTDFPSVREIINDGENGIIGENSAEGVYGNVKQILDNPALIANMKKEVKKYEYDNNSILTQVLGLLEN